MANAPPPPEFTFAPPHPHGSQDGVFYLICGRNNQKTPNKDNQEKKTPNFEIFKKTHTKKLPKKTPNFAIDLK